MLAKSNALSTDLQPILIDRGESSSVVGIKWRQSWKGFNLPALKKKNNIEFHFGDGPAYTSLGACELKLTIPKRFTNQKDERVMTIQIDVVAAAVPMLITQTARPQMGGEIEFSAFLSELPSDLTIQFTQSPA